jgi:NTE family protein
VTRLIDQREPSTQDYTRVRMHRTHRGSEFDALTASSRLNARWEFVRQLKDLGRAAPRGWLAANYRAIGGESTLYLPQAYL